MSPREIAQAIVIITVLILIVLLLVAWSEQATNRKIAECTRAGGIALSAYASNSGKNMVCLDHKLILQDWRGKE